MEKSKESKQSGKLKKYPKPWTKEIHDQFLKDSDKTKEDHDAWHNAHE